MTTDIDNIPVNPCGDCMKDNCPYCDPFSDTVSGDVISDQSDKLNVPPKEVSPIPEPEAAFCASQKAYKEYEEAIGRLAVEEDGATRDRITFETAKMTLVANTDPKVMGSNEEARKAWVFERLTSETLQYQARLRSVELLKAEAEIARIRCRWHDNVLRYLELGMWGGEEAEGASGL